MAKNQEVQENILIVMVISDSEVILGIAMNILPSMRFSGFKLISESFAAVLL